MNAFLIALGGWAAGLLSAVAVDFIRERRLLRATRFSMRWELDELRYRLAIDGFWLMSYAKLDSDTELFRWIAEVHASYDGVDRDPELAFEAELWLKSPPRDAKAPAPDVPLGRRIVTGSRRPTPAFDRAIAHLELFSQEEQVRMLALRWHLERAAIFTEALNAGANEKVDSLAGAREHAYNSGVLAKNVLHALKSAGQACDHLRDQL
jgi:hypothetical protein